MTQRIVALSRYLARSVVLSLTGVFFLIAAALYYFLAFQQPTPEVEYFATIIGIFGAAAAFLLTLSIAGRANEAASYPLFTRLPSRVEFLTAVLLTAVALAVLLQLLVAGLALARNGPVLSLARATDIPPGWLALNILAAVIALHAADFVAAGWSRVYFFGLIALLLFSRGNAGGIVGILADALRSTANFAQRQGWSAIGRALTSAGAWLSGDTLSAAGGAVDLVFWPFRALIDAAVSGRFSTEQALAPAVLLIYATLLFLLAADVFSSKDIVLSEE